MLNMLKLRNYDGIKELLKTIQAKNNISVEITKMCSLGLDYVNKILSNISILNDEAFSGSGSLCKELRDEWYLEWKDYESCLEDCIKIINSDTTLDSLLKDLDERIDELKSELYPGFLTNESDIKEVSMSYNVILEFKNRLERF